MRRRTIIICIAVFIGVMMLCIIFGARYNIDYLGGVGVVICFVGLGILGLINKISALREINHELKELAKEDPDAPANVGELAQACFGLTKKAKRNFKTASFGDKFKVIALFASLGLLLLTMFVGVMFANFGTNNDGTITTAAIIGFILMGIGGGGFFLEIVLLGVISSIKNRKK